MIFSKHTTLIIAAAGMFAARDASAQAWIGEQHDYSASLGYGFSFSSTSLEGNTRISGLGTQVHTLQLGLSYVPFDGLGIQVSLPMSASRYSGPQEGFAGLVLNHGDYDDGSYHTALTDFTAQVGYMISVLDP